MSPRQEMVRTPSPAMSARTACSASRLAWTSLIRARQAARDADEGGAWIALLFQPVGIHLVQRLVVGVVGERVQEGLFFVHRLPFRASERRGLRPGERRGLRPGERRGLSPLS